VKAEDQGQALRVRLTDGHTQWSEACDLLACGFGFVPNVELPLAVGCELRAGFVSVDEWQVTSVANVYGAGEIVGIGGAECALLEGLVAGYAAAGQPERAKAFFPRRSVWRQFRTDLAAAFALRPEVGALATSETVVCRCEDVTYGKMKAFREWRDAKLHSRCGMGACQGRVCGPAAKLLFGWGMESVRPPVFPARVASLISQPKPQGSPILARQ
jgi:NADPH-dependent 2,4-dienoyl-CoA reductase/sulfur reductase-like enzyme